MRVKASTAMSAILLTLSSSLSEVFQMVRKASPLFLFAAPWNSSTTPCTISAIWFTKRMTSAWSTSVAVLKSRMRVEPTTHSTLVPSTMTTTFALSEPRRLCAMMFAPASPKPRASREPSLMMVFSRMTVSMISLPGSWPLQRTLSRTRFSLLSSLRLAFTFCISSTLNSSSATRIAARGSLRKVSTLDIMFSTGFSTSLLASLEKKMETEVRERHTQSTTTRLKVLSFLT
mmetsp:Transcript_96370/g.256051  ORF Transcript_96370/g.256051 Transcript_96370/m.256051 type:complete len:231 (-) Transcript_96370:1314-2006(-)